MNKTRTLLCITVLFFNSLLSIEAQTIVQRYDVVIDEVMTDPSPQVGLPNNEWIELKNTTSLPINLSGWKVADANSTSGPMPNFILKPDSLVIVCAGSALAAMSGFGTAISVTSFPSLDNDGDIISIKDANGKTIHALEYDVSWYQNELKKSGGWSLEMIDTRSPCAGINNWKASTNNSGGTPGNKNSADAANDDQQPPKLERAYDLDDQTIVLVFDEPVDSLNGATITNYSIDGSLIISNAVTLAPLFNKVQLKLVSPLQSNTVYTVIANNITDCRNNVIGRVNQAKVGLPVDLVAGEVIVNEILFNPRANAYDYVEFYNKSNKIFDVSRLYIANRNNSNDIASITPLNATPMLFFPGDYIVVTEDLESLLREYLVRNPECVIANSSLPTFPDDKGYVILLNFQGNIIDEVDYYEAWHFKLIDNKEGVTLERIDPEGPSQDSQNWHSAGSTAGYGTPTYKNSQFKQPPGINASIEVTTKVFSPDNDGFDDIATIQYKVEQPGYVANITIFDAAGRAVKNLVRNGIMATSGYWTWDGLDDKNHKLPVGTYIIFTQIFNLQGKVAGFKNAITLARKLN